MGAHNDGAISGREAEAILHPLHHQISQCLELIDELGDGIVRKSTVVRLSQSERPSQSKSEACRFSAHSEPSLTNVSTGSDTNYNTPILPLPGQITPPVSE